MYGFNKVSQNEYRLWIFGYRKEMIENKRTLELARLDTMKKLILTAALATSALFAGVTEAEAGKCRKNCCPHVCCTLKGKLFPGRVKKSTEKVHTECFYKEECVNGCLRKVLYVRTIYRDTYCNGKTKYWSSTTRG